MAGNLFLRVVAIRYKMEIISTVLIRSQLLELADRAAISKRSRYHVRNLRDTSAFCFGLENEKLIAPF